MGLIEMQAERVKDKIDFEKYIYVLKNKDTIDPARFNEIKRLFMFGFYSPLKPVTSVEGEFSELSVDELMTLLEYQVKDGYSPTKELRDYIIKLRRKVKMVREISLSELKYKVERHVHDLKWQKINQK